MSPKVAMTVPLARTDAGRLPEANVPEANYKMINADSLPLILHTSSCLTLRRTPEAGQDNDPVRITSQLQVLLRSTTETHRARVPVLVPVLAFRCNCHPAI